MHNTFYQKPKITRVDISPPTKLSYAIMQPTKFNNTAYPFSKAMKTISHEHHKPNAPPLRNDFMRRSTNASIMLPKLTKTPRVNRSLAFENKADFHKSVR